MKPSEHSECPKCGGKSGLKQVEWEPVTRWYSWGDDESEAEYDATEFVEAERATCIDCGHRFNSIRRGLA